jgi:hypothetical protein
MFQPTRGALSATHTVNAAEWNELTQQVMRARAPESHRIELAPPAGDHELQRASSGGHVALAFRAGLRCLHAHHPHVRIERTCRIAGPERVFPAILFV